MGDRLHYDVLTAGVDRWNEWRQANPRTEPNLTRFDLSGRDLAGIDLRGAGLFKTNFTGSRLCGANLRQARLVQTVFRNADLTGAHVYGTSAWDVNLAGATQNDLTVTPPGQFLVTVDNLQIAQFIYLLLQNKNIRDVIDTITSKVVLILGRFIDERKEVLDAIRVELRTRGYCPVLFDFDKPASRDITETVSTLAHMARFVIADITDAKSIPQELMAIVPSLPSVAVQPLILKGQIEYGMFEHFRRYPWVLPTHEYEDQAELIANIGKTVISPPETKVRILQTTKG